LTITPGAYRRSAIDFVKQEYSTRWQSRHGRYKALGNPFLANNRRQACTNFASAIRPGCNIAGKKLGQARKVPRFAGCDKGFCELTLFVRRNGDKMTFLCYMAFCSTKELATRLRSFLDYPAISTNESLMILAWLLILSLAESRLSHFKRQ
jgi:hypothetical protein